MGPDNDNKENRYGKLEFSRKINTPKTKNVEDSNLNQLKNRPTYIHLTQLFLFSNRFCVIIEGSNSVLRIINN